MPEPRVERPAMEAYGVPSEPDGMLPWDWARERLVRSKNYWVVTANAAGRPHALPVWGVWDDEGFGFSCAPESRKARNLAVNQQVVVAADDTVEVVSVEGVASPMASGQIQFADAYALKYEPDAVKREAMAGFVLSNLMFRVVPERAFGTIEREDEFAQRATRWAW